MRECGQCRPVRNLVDKTSFSVLHALVMDTRTLLGNPIPIALLGMKT